MGDDFPVQSWCPTADTVSMRHPHTSLATRYVGHGRYEVVFPYVESYNNDPGEVSVWLYRAGELTADNLVPRFVELEGHLTLADFSPKRTN